MFPLVVAALRFPALTGPTNPSALAAAVVVTLRLLVTDEAPTFIALASTSVALPALVISAVSSAWPPLLYPLAIISGAMVIALIGAVNAIVVLTLLRRACLTWRRALAPLLAGVALAMIELTAIGWLRDYLTQHFGLPF